MRLFKPVFRHALALCGAALWFASGGVLAQISPETARVIVKLKSPPVAIASPDAVAPPSQVQGLAHRLGMTMRERAGPTERTRVVTARGLDSRQLAQRLARDSEVEYAVPDERRHRLSAPNDPRYAVGLAEPGPTTGQWYLRAPQGQAQSSINVEGAWAAALGTSRHVVVALLDSGVRFDHPDLRRFADGGNLLDGHDFITDPFLDNDGTPGRDSDASDPGDWVSEADVNSPANTVGCTPADVAPSSWHGTQTAGLLGATTHNALGMAGMTGAGRNVLVLPVRVLGRCGGFDSDIIPAMRWAAGLRVPGVPANPNPARVINLSLGGAGVCGEAYRDAIREINQAGVVVVAAAGNTSGGAVNAPANCPGVIAVTGLRQIGSKVGYSDLGPEIALSAPAGNCVNLSGECLYPLLTTTNSGATTPVAAEDAYTDGVNVTAGTSFSAPLVAGAAALMLAVQPGLNADEVRQLLRVSARAFPTTGDEPGVGLCQAPTVDADDIPVEQLECYCTTSTCGAGMLDASAAVALAQTTQASSDSHGGGALGWGWLLALGLAVRAVARSHRHA
jgi:serine protease